MGLYCFARCELDTERRVLKVEDIPRDVEPLVFDMLTLFLNRGDTVVSRDELVDKLWNGRVISDSAISVKINAARNAVGDNGKDQAIIKTVHRKGFKLVVPVTQTSDNLFSQFDQHQTAAVSKKPANYLNTKVADKPSIAVLPFDNMSGDPEQAFFADGIAEDIITALSRFHDLLVIARNSSFAYRGNSVDLRQVGRELDVQYILEGSVRTASKRVRITVQLIEAHSGYHVWAERFDRPLEDVFDVQDEITALVASTVGRQMSIAEYRNSFNRTERDLDYRGLVHRAMWHQEKLTRKDCARTREFAQQLLDEYPERVGGYSLMAYVSKTEFAYGWGDLPREQLKADAVKYATAGIQIDPDDEWAHSMMGEVYWLTGKHDAAIAECEAVIRLNPNFTYAYGLLGIIHANSGSGYYKQAVLNLEYAIRLSPNDPWLQYYFVYRGAAEFFNKNYQAAIDWYHRSLQRNPGASPVHRRLTAALAMNGELEKARAALDELLRVEPNCSVADMRQRFSLFFRHQRDFEFYMDAMRLAGLPEE